MLRKSSSDWRFQNETMYFKKHVFGASLCGNPKKKIYHRGKIPTNFVFKFTWRNKTQKCRVEEIKKKKQTTDKDIFFFFKTPEKYWLSTQVTSILHELRLVVHNVTCRSDSIGIYKLWKTKRTLGSTAEYKCKYENTANSNTNLSLENTHTSAILLTYVLLTYS